MNVQNICTVKLQTLLWLLLLLQVFHFALVDGASCNSLNTPQDYCANPIKADVDIKWFHEHFEDGWYLQYGNPEMRKLLSNLFPGNENEKGELQLCPKVKLDYLEDHFISIYYDYTNKDIQQAYINCTGNDCIFTSNDKLFVEEVKGYTSYLDTKGKDEHNVLSIVVCFKNGDVGQLVLSISKTISEEETNTLIEHQKSIGFNPDLRVPLQSASCS